MKLRQSVRESPEINLTPLIDVVFLLLIFFMVSTTFSQDSELGIELPTAEQEPQDRAPRTIEIAVDVQGRYYVNGGQLPNSDLETLKQAISEAAQLSGDGASEPSRPAAQPSILLSADAQTPHQAVVLVMDAVSQLGFSRLSFATLAAPTGN